MVSKQYFSSILYANFFLKIYKKESSRYETVGNVRHIMEKRMKQQSQSISRKSQQTISSSSSALETPSASAGSH